MADPGMDTIPVSSSPDNELVPASLITGCVQEMIKHAPRQHWQEIWSAYTAGLAVALEAAPHRLPWQDPSEVTEITKKDGASACISALRAVEDREERLRLARDLAGRIDAAEKATEARRSREKALTPGRYGIIRCALPSCEVAFAPKSPAARYCSGACRTAAWEARKKAKAGR